jgi:hypothetical protein
MSLLGDIINELADKNVSLTYPLLKTKILAKRLRNKQLIDWVDKELGVYPNGEEIPDYRKYPAKLTLDATEGPHQFNDYPVPTYLLPDDVRAGICTVEIRQAVAALETLISSDKSGTVEISLPAEALLVVQDSIRQTGHPDFRMHALHKTVSISIIAQVLASIRKKLLDFALELEQEFGEETDIQTLKANNLQITHIMNTTINTTGNSNTVNTGSGATVTATINQQSVGQGVTAESVAEEIRQLTAQIQELLRQSDGDKDAKEEVVHQLATVDRQVGKETPNFTIAGKALGVVETLLTDALSGQTAPVILAGIQQVIGHIQTLSH